MCPALTVSKLLHTLPSSCGSSRMKINTKCSFTCPQGYQLRGPSYKQCRVDGQWSDKAKKVSCTGESWNFGVFYDLVFHMIINVWFSQILTSVLCRISAAAVTSVLIPWEATNAMQCPDPELSLSPADNKTCHGKMKILNLFLWFGSQTKRFSTQFLLQ